MVNARAARAINREALPLLNPGQVRARIGRRRWGQAGVSGPRVEYHISGRRRSRTRSIEAQQAEKRRAAIALGRLS